ncbi:MAG: hypothetical protein OER86_13380, partial [Phycisphaerae bacterium]|nr:hypothetical protein [Phycisphaerae bacterium]
MTNQPSETHPTPPSTSPSRDAPAKTSRGGGDVLSAGVGTAAAMWAIGYVARMPGVVIPPALLAAGLGLCMVGGGLCLGRWSQRGVGAAAAAGALTACVNLLVLGSLLVDPVTGRLGSSALLWIPGTIAATVAIFLGGFLLVRRRPAR